MTRKKSAYSIQLSVLSFIATGTAFWQLWDLVDYYRYPNSPLSCNLNPIIDCGGVINHDLSSVFGPPNMLIGIIAFSLLFGVGISLLYGMKLNRGAITFITALVSAMMLFSLWFFGASLYVIGKVCIFCVGIWAAEVPLFYYTWRQFLNMNTGLNVPGWLRQVITKYPERLIVSTYVLMGILFLARFQDYYF